MSNVPDIRFKGFTDAWEQRELGEVVDFSIKTNSLSRANLSQDSGEIKNIHYGDILVKFNSVLDLKTEKLPFINSEYSTLDKFQFLKDGDLVFADAAEDNSVGKCIEVRGVLDDKVTSGLHTIAGTPKMNFASFYLGYYLNSNNYHDKILPLIQGTKVSSISKNNLSKSIINYPKNFEEQQKIGKLFIEIDQTITLLQRELDLENKTIEMFMDNLFIQKEQNIPCFNLSENTAVWKSVKLKEIGDTFTGLSGKNKDDFGHGDAWYITYMNVFSNPISNFNDKEKIEIDFKQNEVKYGDIFFTTSSETPNEVGMSSVWLGDDANIYLNSFCFGFRPKVELNPYFIAYLLRSKEVRMKISKLAQGISRYNISKTKMMEIEINIPDIKTQNEVGRILKELNEKKQITEKQIEKAKIIKKAFLQKLFPKGD
ncbi:restriction endonuclease subunit S [Macrococcus sp. FSL R5-0951]